MNPELDFSTLLPDPYGPKRLERIFDWQKDYIDILLSRGKFIPYPVAINSPNDQAFVRELMGFFLEELCEAFEKFEDMASVVLTQAPDTWDNKTLQSNIEDYNEELSDSIHLMVEILLVSAITSSDVHSYYQHLLTERKLESIWVEDDILQSALNYSMYLNAQEGLVQHGSLSRKVVPQSKTNYFTRAGNQVSVEKLEIHKTLLWDVVVAMNKAKNCLKNKFWKETPVDTNTQKYQELLMEAWLRFFKYLHFAGLIEPIDVYAIYFFKNQANLKRLQNKY